MTEISCETFPGECDRIMFLHKMKKITIFGLIVIIKQTIAFIKQHKTCVLDYQNGFCPKH